MVCCLLGVCRGCCLEHRPLFNSHGRLLHRGSQTMRAKKAWSVGLLHRGSQVMRAKKASNVGRRTIRSNLHAICGSARVPSCEVSRSVKVQIQRLQTQTQQSGSCPMRDCEVLQTSWQVACRWWELISEQENFANFIGMTL